MTICDHWRNAGIERGGDCAAGFYPRPSFGVCLKVCPHRVIDGVPQPPQPTLAPDIVSQYVLDHSQQVQPEFPVRLTPSAPSKRDIENPASFFDRAVVITLRRTPDRLAQFLSRPSPFKPEIFYAVDGDYVPAPEWFHQGGGAWGCWRSHVRVIEQALMDGINWLLVMEDDCAFVPDAESRLKEFLSKVPADAHCLMIGGQQHDDGQTIPICPGVRKVSQCERTHCYALSREGMKSLYRWWNDANDAHCDWQLGDWQESGVNCYRPDPFIAYQASNFSTIRWQYEPDRAWDGGVSMASRNPATIPVVILQCTRETLDLMRRRGAVHSGFWRDEEDIDKGLVQALKGDDPAKAIAELVQVLRGEVAGFDRAIVALWHPRSAVELSRRRNHRGRFCR
jgi:GR25 family glycosyltransferase involved in LPS biosynthesis